MALYQSPWMGLSDSINRNPHTNNIRANKTLNVCYDRKKDFFVSDLLEVKTTNMGYLEA